MPGRTCRGFPEDQRGVEDDEYKLREIGCGVGDRGFGWRVEKMLCEDELIEEEMSPPISDFLY